MKKLSNLLAATAIVLGLVAPITSARDASAAVLPICSMSFSPNTIAVGDITNFSSSIANFSGYEEILLGGTDAYIRGEFESLEGMLNDLAGEMTQDTYEDWAMASAILDLFDGVPGPNPGEFPVTLTLVIAAPDSLTSDPVLTSMVGMGAVYRLTGPALCSASLTINGPVEEHAFTTEGFFAPVDGNGVVNTVKAGSTVPLKFSVLEGDTVVSDTAVVDSFTQQEYTCGTDVTFDAVEVVTTGGTSLRYDGTTNQFIQNWKTPLGKNKCYKVTVTIEGGQTIQALFKTK